MRKIKFPEGFFDGFMSGFMTLVGFGHFAMKNYGYSALFFLLAFALTIVAIKTEGLRTKLTEDSNPET